MKFSSKLAALVLVFLALAGCNKAVEENAPAKEGSGNNAENTGEMQRKLPECAKRNKDGTYKYGAACSEEQWVEWQKTQDALTAPSK